MTDQDLSVQMVRVASLTDNILCLRGTMRRMRRALVDQGGPSVGFCFFFFGGPVFPCSGSFDSP